MLKPPIPSENFIEAIIIERINTMNKIRFIAEKT